MKLYGAEPGKPSFATNCLLARRLVERGVRFVQLYHTDWDHHGDPGQTLNRDLDQVCRDIDQPCAALIRDLKARGLLDSTRWSSGAASSAARRWARSASRSAATTTSTR